MQKGKWNLGFTTVEVFISLAIVAIMATIATIQYQHMANQGRQGEVKTNLSALYAGEKIFYANFKHSTTALDVVGFNPQGELNYAYGYNSNYDPPLPSPFPVTMGAACWATNLNPYQCNPVARWTNSLMVPSPTQSPFPTPVSWNWIAFANSNLTASGADVWSIDSGDNLINIRPGF